jgi:hypothetical protein
MFTGELLLQSTLFVPVPTSILYVAVSKVLINFFQNNLPIFNAILRRYIDSFITGSDAALPVILMNQCYVILCV